MIQHSLCLIVFHNGLSIKTGIEHQYFQSSIHALNTQAATLLPRYQSLSLTIAEVGQIIITTKSKRTSSIKDLGEFRRWHGHVTRNLPKNLTTIAGKKGSSTIIEVNILLILFITSYWLCNMVE